jgi:molybdopterin converting factor small subunit
LIKVGLLGHIKSSVGAGEVCLPDEELEVTAIIDRLRLMCPEDSPGFNIYNTLAMVEDGEAFVPASRSTRVKSGQRVVLLPFSHGG